jgi:hypothetical protein
MRVKFAEVMEAFDFVSASELDEHQAWLNRRTGEIIMHSDLLVAEDPLPSDVADDGLYLEIPHRRELALGRRVAIDFAAELMPKDVDEVRRIFSKRGAYGRFKALLERRRLLERWYDFSNQAEEAALRAWCEEEGVVLAAP